MILNRHPFLFSFSAVLQSVFYLDLVALMLDSRLVCEAAWTDWQRNSCATRAGTNSSMADI
jgi:hypothetical protein